MAGGHREQRALESSLSAAPRAGRQHGPQTPDGPATPGRAEPHTERPRPKHPAGATRARLGARALALRCSRGQGPKQQRILNGKLGLFL